MNKINLETFELKSGSHSSIEKGACVMELVSYLANEPWSDHPKCACPILTSYAIIINDRVDGITRQKLKPILSKLLNSKSTREVEVKRAEFLARRSFTVFLPLLTEKLKLVEITEKLRSMKKTPWLKVRDYINSIKPQIRGAAADAAAYDAAAYAAADAAAYAAAYAADAAAKQPIYDAWIKSLEEACEII